MEPRIPTALDDFLFDLNGYLVLKKAVEPELLAELNDAFDRLPPLQQGEWLATRNDATTTAQLATSCTTVSSLILRWKS